MSVPFRDRLFTLTPVGKTTSGGQYDLILNPRHPIYGGHFPGNPVTPGVVSFQLMEEVFAEHAGCKIRLRQLRELKFLGFIDPRTHPVVRCDLSVREEGELRQVSATLGAGPQSFVRMKATYRVG